MKKITLYLTILLVVGLFTSCKDYVTNVDPLVDQVKNDALNTPEAVPTLIAGVEYAFANASAQLYVDADLLSDQFFFDFGLRGATYPSFLEIDQLPMTLTNNNVRNTYSAMGRAWYYATNLLDRLSKISGVDAATTQEAKFVGTFYSSYVLYQYASYFELYSTGQPGSPVNGGKFESASDLYAQALAGFKESLNYAADAAQTRMVNTTIARTYLYMGDYANATTYALQGMAAGDDPFDLLYSVQNPSEYYSNAGQGREQVGCDTRYEAYITADPNEANRIPMFQDLGFWIQAKVYNQDDPLPITTWQENNLILAECALRGQTAAGDPLVLVNEVRASHNIAPAASVVLINAADPYDPTVCSIYSERDKELFCTGNRLIDNRRFDQFNAATGLTVSYFPITVDEIDSNPNL